MKVAWYDKCPNQHALYGPSAPIAHKITPDNWQEVAIVRGEQYIYIARGYWGGAEEKNWRGSGNWRNFSKEPSPLLGPSFTC